MYFSHNVYLNIFLIFVYAFARMFGYNWKSRGFSMSCEYRFSTNSSYREYSSGFPIFLCFQKNISVYLQCSHVFMLFLLIFNTSFSWIRFHFMTKKLYSNQQYNSNVVVHYVFWPLQASRRILCVSEFVPQHSFAIYEKINCFCVLKCYI